MVGDGRELEIIEVDSLSIGDVNHEGSLGDLFEFE
jgi:hypothetical protein